MRKMILLIIVGLFLVGGVSAYYCIDPQEDNEGVVNFKNKINILALENDIAEHDLTREAFNLKIKYFNPCR